MTYYVGWDIGGAHVKVAIIFQNKIIKVQQEFCPLWQGLDKLELAVQKILHYLPTDKNQKHAVTMTGELVDLFVNRHDGVKQIMQTMKRLLSNFDVHIFCGKLDLLPVDKVGENHYETIASANWHVVPRNGSF